MRSRSSCLIGLGFFLSLSGIIHIPPAAPAAEIGYIEEFALAKDRAAALKQLIPGSEDAYYYNSLHLQNLGQFDQVNQLIPQWIGRYGHTPRLIEIQLRQALLTYDRNPQQSLEFIRRHLNIEFNHQQEKIGAKPNLPSELDPRLISRERLTQEALTRYSSLDNFEDVALDWLVGRELDPDRRRNLLQRLQRPDYPNLPKLVVDDLAHANSRGFGAFAIHQKLLLSQLDECLRLKPDLLNQQNFVNAYITKLHPSADADWQHDTKEREAYLNRLWAFVQQLAPAHNSLKAHVLYHRLVHDRAQGLYDKQRFLEYIQLPRQAVYIARGFLEQDRSRRFIADLNADFNAVTLLPPVGNDEPLVRDYLQHFFREETTTKPYEPYINDVYLRHTLAETKILYGLGDPEQWYAMLPPERYQQLKDRIELEFAPSNQTYFAADEPVKLDIDVKNVRTLIVKVFEVNAKNYYQQYQREVNTDVSLDGLVANDEQTVEYTEPPLRRVRRHFEFPSLARPGVYVIDFIGNGMSSRAVIRKGQLRHLVRTSTAGHIFTILDEQNNIVKDGSIWLAGHEYSANKNGHIVVPYTDQPGTRPIILSRGTLSTLDHFDHQAESYSLAAAMFVERESLLARREAELVVRPALYLNGLPVTLSVLDEVKLTITSTDHDGISTTKEVAPFQLYEDRESVFKFQTPARLASISFTLSAKVQNLSQNKKIDLSTSQSYSLNSIDKTDKVEDLHLAKVDGLYRIELLGKTGEAKGERAVQIALKHRDFREPIQVSLKSDPRGQISLGALEDIVSVTATAPEGIVQTWSLIGDHHTYHDSIHGLAGEPLHIPLMEVKEPLSRSDVSFLEMRGETFVADRFENLSARNGMLVIEDLPAGDYNLWLKKLNRHIRIRLTAGERRESYVLGNKRQLEVRGLKPLQIADVQTGDDGLTIKLENATKFARVHVFATRYLPAHHPFRTFARIDDPEPARIMTTRTDARYVSGRNIGDEYRYIIERKFATKFPGVMLERPSLLLNPWAVRTTETGKQQAKEGDEFAAVPPPTPSQRIREEAAPSEPAGAEQQLTSNLDFLGEAAVVLTNLVPDENGIIEIGEDELGAHQHVHVIAVDPTNTAYRSVSLPDPTMEFVDLRLTKGLDPAKHFTQQKKITVVPAGGDFELVDIVTSRFETYDSLADVYVLYATLSRNPLLAEFSFILNWPKLSAEEKQAKYSKYACHELNFFLFKKDPEFFNSVVKPYLANKKDRTFLDDWLLGGSLESYLDPWRYEQLNVVERILLAQRVEQDRVHGVRHIQDLYDLLPADVERFNFLFRTAIRGSALETSEALGVIAGFESRSWSSSTQFGAPQLPALEGRFSGDFAVNGGVPGAPAAAPESAERQLKQEKLDMLADSVKAKGSPADKKMGRRMQRNAGGGLGGVGPNAAYADDLLERESVRQLFEQLDKTQEWAENNYYKLPIDQQNADLITVNAFWRDFAKHSGDTPFSSIHLAEASRNFTEIMFSLSVLDLPFEAKQHESKLEQTSLKLTAASPTIIFHEEIREAGSKAQQTPILVSQNFFGAHDRYRYENNEQLDKFVTEEFLVHTVYGCQVVVTNPTSSPQKLDVLTQIPVGAIAVSGGEATRSVHIQLDPFSTKTIEYYFYFPAAGKYPHYPVHVSKNEQLLASAEPVTLVAVEQLSRIDRESWAYISQYGTNEQVLEFLRTANLLRLDLAKIAFRMNDEKFFLNVVDLLSARHAYNDALWSYGIKHKAVKAVREYLQHRAEFLAQIGESIDSPLVTVDPVLRKTYQHLDYMPLVNARAHQLGRERQILNDRLFDQYHRLLKIVAYHRELSDEDKMSVTYYLLLQDRIEEANRFFAEVNPEKLTTRLQYDYFAAYLKLYQEDVSGAEEIAQRYEKHPVDRWRNSFVAMKKQIDEIKGMGSTEVQDPENRGQVQTQLASSEPSFEFKVEGRNVQLTFQNLKRISVNYYLMDIELLFSRNPFVQTRGGQFSHIRPNLSQQLELPEGKSAFEFALPDKLRNSNVLIEVTAAGQTKSQPYYANSMAVQLTENYGQLRVVTANPGRPLSKVYVKTYAKMKDGSVRFFKDGYTDLRGRFDYASLSTNELDHVERFAILILSDEHGAMVREAAPPLR